MVKKTFNLVMIKTIVKYSLLGFALAFLIVPHVEVGGIGSPVYAQGLYLITTGMVTQMAMTFVRMIKTMIVK